ncbi:MAG: AmmeMemoRadiSam system protein A [Anaerolineaceae bacterium]|nr:AmmeMemoRadiSam system protein A [Anaerolineaceae bacterium]
MPTSLTHEEKRILLSIARQSITEAVKRNPVPELVLKNLPEKLQTHGASFVTLTIKGELRGCIGALEAYQPLALDVQDHAIAAALMDSRFLQVSANELEDIKIEISWLSEPEELIYEGPEKLIEGLHPGVDGVILKDGQKRATFLPQVWEKLPDPVDFLGHLCMKMGSSPDLWQKRLLEVKTYQVEEFNESQFS